MRERQTGKAGGVEWREQKQKIINIEGMRAGEEVETEFKTISLEGGTERRKMGYC